MVEDLFATPRAGQEVDVNVFANDVVTVQTAEIGIMRQMLSAAARPVAQTLSRLHPELSRCTFARRLFALVAAARSFRRCSPRRRIRPSDDPRSNLKPGRLDAGEAAQQHAPRVLHAEGGELRHGARPDVHQLRPGVRRQVRLPGQLRRLHDLGRERPDEADDGRPRSQCITSQGDPSIYGNLLFLSAEGGGNRNDCAKGGVQDPKDHMAGVRIYDVSNPAQPQLVKNVQTCKGSHTHTIVPQPEGQEHHLHLRVGQPGARVRTPRSPGARNGTDPADETNSLFRLDVIKVPLDNPEKAEVVTGARIFTGLEPAPRAASRPRSRWSRRARRRRSTQPRAAATAPTGPRNCHDVTAYPAMNLLAGACGSYGLLVDISNPEKPVRLDAKADTNFSLWHTAVFSNDGKKVVFTDEWGGGTSPMCQANSMMEMGGNTILTIDAKKKYKQHAYFKIPTAQTAAGELRVAQRRPDPGAGARHHGAGLVSGRRERDGLHRPGQADRARVLRSRLDRSAAECRRAGRAAPAPAAVAAAARSAARGARTTGTATSTRRSWIAGSTSSS